MAGEQGNASLHTAVHFVGMMNNETLVPTPKSPNTCNDLVSLVQQGGNKDVQDGECLPAAPCNLCVRECTSDFRAVITSTLRRAAPSPYARWIRVQEVMTPPATLWAHSPQGVDLGPWTAPPWTAPSLGPLGFRSGQRAPQCMLKAPAHQKRPQSHLNSLNIP